MLFHSKMGVMIMPTPRVIERLNQLINVGLADICFWPPRFLIAARGVSLVAEQFLPSRFDAWASLVAWVLDAWAQQVQLSGSRSRGFQKL